jgi:hypothetical protein
MPQTFDKIPDVDVNTPSQNRPPESNNQNTGIKVSQGVLRHGTSGEDADTGSPTTSLLPEKVFSIQLGSDLFRLSGSSIASDGQLLVVVLVYPR